ncbi:hypothetical protein [Streptomyces sp. NBC_01353]|uniref:hypothetical protein n=1 Tax=Streptomyces sp. NBC_01353 TaxID=2903835 RepID=UPI002E315F2A|nr:hypothetical protein [Streptomyces sp. NBC_01353]
MSRVSPNREVSPRDDLLNILRATHSHADAEAKVNALRDQAFREAEDAIAEAVERNRDEHPSEDAMVARRLGMRQAERVVRSLRSDKAGDES